MDTFVLTGCSAGGLATYNWADYFYKTLTDQNEKVKYFAIPDSGFFLNYTNV